MQNHITEKMQEVISLVNEDVQRKLDGMCETYTVDVRGLMLEFQESHIVSGRDMGEVASVVDSRLIENNERNNQQENVCVLELLNEEVQWLREELKESRNNNQQLQGNQRRMEQRIEDERNRANGK